MPMPPPSINVPVINIQYNFHFPPGGAAGSEQQQVPLTAEQLLANRVLQGALAQQGMPGHIPSQHVLNPEREAVRQMTERLNQVAAQGTEPYTGRQSPGRRTLFRQLPKTPTVPPVPPLRGRDGASQSQERRTQRGMRAIVALLAFLMFVFVVLYALGLIGRRKYFMYYS